MGLIAWLRRTNRIADEMRNQSLSDEVSTVRVKSRRPRAASEENVREEKEHWNFAESSEREAYVENCKSRLQETARANEEMKREYQQVTSYLTDIQRVDAIPGEDRKTLEEMARKIVTLVRERSEYKSRASRLNESQYRMMEQYADNMQDEISHLEEAEGYRLVIRNDMRQLEMEKNVLMEEQKSLRNRQIVLKKLTIVTVALVAALLILLACVYVTFHVAIELPFIMIIVMGAGVGFYIMWEAGRNRREMELDNRKMNRAVSLLNRVKIKCVNQESLLEYIYGKYHVATAADLQGIYQAYLKEKEEEREFQQNTRNLNQFQEQLMVILAKYQVSDCEIWLYQATALLDGREMVEVRHRLNVRRGKLREHLDANQMIQTKTLEQMKEFVREYPPYEMEYQRLRDKYLALPEDEQ